ncbi:hypothetical protein [Hydrogenibacillus schlegelii]|uniref:hypothetical protein n=1 Tax=Hydrogenibacillus schlegelii TaxID=1484 RepID=UPI00349FEDE7
MGRMVAGRFFPVWTEAVGCSAEAAGVVVLFLLLHVYRLPPAAVVAAGAGWGCSGQEGCQQLKIRLIFITFSDKIYP